MPTWTFAEEETRYECLGRQCRYRHVAPPVGPPWTRPAVQHSLPSIAGLSGTKTRRAEGGGYVGLVAYWLLKAILTPIFFVLWRVKVEGRENIPKHGPAVLASNHQSFCDSFFIPLVVTRKVTFLAKAEYFDSWKTAWFFRAAGQIPIQRGGGSASERALNTARTQVLGKGNILGLYPEGTRSVDEYVHKGRTGVTRLSRECGVSIIPVGVVGTVEVQPVNSKILRPFKTVTIRFGQPMQMEEPANPDDPMEGHDHTLCRSFTDDLMHEIARLSEREYVNDYVPSRSTPSSTPA